MKKIWILFLLGFVAKAGAETRLAGINAGNASVNFYVTMETMTLTALDESSFLMNGVSTINCVGAGITCTNEGNGILRLTVNATGGGGGGGGSLVYFDGSQFVSVSSMSFPHIQSLSDGSGHTTFYINLSSINWTGSHTFGSSTTINGDVRVNTHWVHLVGSSLTIRSNSTNQRGLILDGDAANVDTPILFQRDNATKWQLTNVVSYTPNNTLALQDGGGNNVNTFQTGADGLERMMIGPSVSAASSTLNVSAGAGAQQTPHTGNVSIGRQYSAIAAPTNGMIVEGNVGIGVSAVGNALVVSGSQTIIGTNGALSVSGVDFHTHNSTTDARFAVVGVDTTTLANRTPVIVMYQNGSLKGDASVLDISGSAVNSFTCSGTTCTLVLTGGGGGGGSTAGFLFTGSNNISFSTISFPLATITSDGQGGSTISFVIIFSTIANQINGLGVSTSTLLVMVSTTGLALTNVANSTNAMRAEISLNISTTLPKADWNIHVTSADTKDRDLSNSTNTLLTMISTTGVALLNVAPSTNAARAEISANISTTLPKADWNISVSTNDTDHVFFKTALASHSLLDLTHNTTMYQIRQDTSTMLSIIKTTAAELSDNTNTINAVTNPVSWNSLKDVPAGFADGSDDGAGGGGITTDQANALIISTWNALSRPFWQQVSIPGASMIAVSTDFMPRISTFGASLNPHIAPWAPVGSTVTNRFIWRVPGNIDTSSTVMVTWWIRPSSVSANTNVNLVFYSSATSNSTQGKIQNNVVISTNSVCAVGGFSQGEDIRCSAELPVSGANSLNWTPGALTYIGVGRNHDSVKLGGTNLNAGVFFNFVSMDVPIRRVSQ